MERFLLTMERYLWYVGTMRKQVWVGNVNCAAIAGLRQVLMRLVNAPSASGGDGIPRLCMLQMSPQHSPLPQAEPIPAECPPNPLWMRSARSAPAMFHGEVDPEPAEDCTPECCECGHKLTGKVVKGVVVAWACPELGCAMYGLERGDA